MIPPKILLVDDDEDDRFFFGEALKEIDPFIKYEFAGNGDEALQRLNKSGISAPDYIFLDLNMPKISGKQCLKEIKKCDWLLNIPVIIYSTSKSESDIEETRALGASFFLTKPFEFTDLCEAIRMILGLERSARNSAFIKRHLVSL